MRACVLALMILLASAQITLAQSPPLIATSDNFRLYCIPSSACGDASTLSAQGATVLSEMEEISIWFAELKFPKKSNLEKSRGTPPQQFLRLERQSTGGGRCGSNSNACYKYEIGPGEGRIFLPSARFEGILNNTSTLAHEYLHTRQPGRDPGKVRWLSEAVATAVGTAWGIKRGGSEDVYEPKYLMTLDKSFYEAGPDDDPGYGNWAYLMAVGREMGSQDQVAYLADDVFMKATTLYTSAAGAMAPFYNASRVDGQTFDKFFPRFVARFNNMEKVPELPDQYYYYTAIAKETVSLAGTDSSEQHEISGSVKPYAAGPVHMKLQIGAAGSQRGPKDRLLMADIEIIQGDKLDDLTLVAEHTMGETRRRKSYMINGAEPADELGFYRVVYAPKSVLGDGAAASKFTVRVTTTPIGFEPPACFQAGVATAFEPVDFDPDRTGNWRLLTDNGSVDGLTVTPAQAGNMEVKLEIDSPVTRQNGTLAKKSPKTTRVSLGTFDVVSDDCMIRLSTTGAVMTYVFDGSYTEIKSPSGEAVYFGPADFAAYQGGWRSIPEQGKQMMISRMAAQMPAVTFIAPGEDEAQGTFLSRMPHAFSKRFAWANLRKARSADGTRQQRTRIDCPDGGSGCSTTTVSGEGASIPVVFDANDRPITVDMQGQVIRFEYGHWNVRRPPGW